MPNIALTDDEVLFIEKFRKLLPEFQLALIDNADTLFQLQTRILKDFTEQMFGQKEEL